MYAATGQIPTRPEESGNVTFTISSEDPIRSELVFSRIRPNEETKRRDPLIFDPATRRETFGERIFTAIEKRFSGAQSPKVFDIGQQLEFEEETIITDINVVSAPDRIDIRHDLSAIDLQSLGLSVDDIAQIDDTLRKKKAEIEDEIAQFQRQRNSIRDDIIAKQRQVNESSRSINALSVAGVSDDIINTLKETRDKATSDLEGLQVEFNTTLTELNEKADELQKISVLVH